MYLTGTFIKQPCDLQSRRTAERETGEGGSRSSCGIVNYYTNYDDDDGWVVRDPRPDSDLDSWSNFTSLLCVRMISVCPMDKRWTLNPSVIITIVIQSRYPLICSPWSAAFNKWPFYGTRRLKRNLNTFSHFIDRKRSSDKCFMRISFLTSDNIVCTLGGGIVTVVQEQKEEIQKLFDRSQFTVTLISRDRVSLLYVVVAWT